MSLLIISSSLNPNSRSRRLAKVAVVYATEAKIEASYLDLSDFPLDICDGGKSFEHANLKPISKLIEQADAIVLCGPIYAYAMAAATKNLIELTGRAWMGKPVGIMASAGGKNSYMAVLGTANSLMLDYRCPIVPKYVYVDPNGFDENSGEVKAEIGKRIAELVDTTDHWGQVL